MPWGARSLLGARLRLVQDWRRPGWSVAEGSRRYQVSRKTGYKWLERYGKAGPGGLVDRSHRPYSCPHATPAAVVEQILGLQRRYRWSARKVRWLLAQRELIEPRIRSRTGGTSACTRRSRPRPRGRHGARSPLSSGGSTGSGSATTPSGRTKRSASACPRACTTRRRVPAPPRSCRSRIRGIMKCGGESQRWHSLGQSLGEREPRARGTRRGFRGNRRRTLGGASVRCGSVAYTRPPAGSWIIWVAPPAAKAGITKGKCYPSADNKLLPII